MLWDLQVETVDVHGGCGTHRQKLLCACWRSETIHVHAGGCGTYRQKSLCVCWRSETVDVHVGGQKLQFDVHAGRQKLLCACWRSETVDVPVLHHVIVMSHPLHVIVMPTLFQALDTKT